jgi:amidase
LFYLTLLQRIAREIARFFLRYDLWLAPTVAEPPPLLGSFDPPPDNPLQGLKRAEDFVPITPIANFTGQPAMSMPLYWNADGLPIGVHFMARFGDEATLFRLAAQLEQVRPWAQRRPEIS